MVSLMSGSYPSAQYHSDGVRETLGIMREHVGP